MVIIWTMMVNNNLVGGFEPYPSEKWWSSDQLGLWHSRYMEKMFQTTNQSWFIIIFPTQVDIYHRITVSPIDPSRWRMIRPDESHWCWNLFSAIPWAHHPLAVDRLETQRVVQHAIRMAAFFGGYIVEKSSHGEISAAHIPWLRSLHALASC